MSNFSLMFRSEKIYGGASGWLAPGFLAALPIAFHCFSLGLWAAYCSLSSLIFMRFCPALGFPHLFPQLPCIAPVSVPPYANAYQMILIFGFSRLEGKVPSAHTGRMRWKSCVFDESGKVAPVGAAIGRPPVSLAVFCGRAMLAPTAAAPL